MLQNIKRMFNLLVTVTRHKVAGDGDHIRLKFSEAGKCVGHVAVSNRFANVDVRDLHQTATDQCVGKIGNRQSLVNDINPVGLDTQGIAQSADAAQQATTNSPPKKFSPCRLLGVRCRQFCGQGIA